MGMGYDVVNIGLAKDPYNGVGGDRRKGGGRYHSHCHHNPKQWNALKLLNEKGEFLNDEEGKGVLAIAEAEDFSFAEVDPARTHHRERLSALPYSECIRAEIG